MLDIRRIKELLDSSQIRFEKDFAEMLHVTEQGWNNIKRKGSTTKSRAKKIANILNVPIEEILTTKYYKENKQLFQSSTSPNGISVRLRELIKFLNINQSEFAKEVQVPNSTLSSVMSRDTGKIDFIQQIAKRYKWVNLRWLISGEGNIRINTEINENANESLLKKITQLEEELQRHKLNYELIKKELEEIKKEIKI
jgi:transcriptional regulator with XRE-family HTH domain